MRAKKTSDEQQPKTSCPDPCSILRAALRLPADTEGEERTLALEANIRALERFQLAMMDDGWPGRVTGSLRPHKVRPVDDRLRHDLELAWARLRARDGGCVAIAGPPLSGRTWLAAALGALLMIEGAFPETMSSRLIRRCHSPSDAVETSASDRGRGSFANVTIPEDVKFELLKRARFLVVENVGLAAQLQAWERERWDELKEARKAVGLRTVFIGHFSAEGAERAMPGIATIDLNAVSQWGA